MSLIKEHTHKDYIRKPKYKIKSSKETVTVTLLHFLINIAVNYLSKEPF